MRFSNSTFVNSDSVNSVYSIPATDGPVNDSSEKSVPNESSDNFFIAARLKNDASG